jgi:hypothetical protein
VDDAEGVRVQTPLEMLLTDAQVVERGASVDPQRVVLLLGRDRFERIEERLRPSASISFASAQLARSME